MLSHTPGPYGYGTAPHVVVEARSGTVLAVVCNPGPARGGEETQDANCRLFAAAPDLLAACKAVVSYLADNRGREQMEAAIAKAEGR